MIRRRRERAEERARRQQPSPPPPSVGADPSWFPPTHDRPGSHGLNGRLLFRSSTGIGSDENATAADSKRKVEVCTENDAREEYEVVGGDGEDCGEDEEDEDWEKVRLGDGEEPWWIMPEDASTVMDGNVRRGSAL